MLKVDKDLEPFNPVVQIRPRCGKVDIYKDGNHTCFLN